MGFIKQEGKTKGMPEQLAQDWQNNRAVLWPQAFSHALDSQKPAFEQSLQTMIALLKGEELDLLIEKEPYQSRLKGFPLVSSVHDEGDPQEIHKLFFDAERAEQDDAQDLWCKASWLSYDDEDASLRFRFSWGMEGIEDVSLDLEQERAAAQLCLAMFPESALLQQHPRLRQQMQEALNCDAIDYVECIIYFNAPNGGAQLHHDVERGHAGVVYAQATGSSFWLALNTDQLIQEIRHFAQTQAALLPALCTDKNETSRFIALCSDAQQLRKTLQETPTEALEKLLNHCPEFLHQLCTHEHAFVVQAGDFLLLPQRDLDHCVWHAVFCLGDEPGEALSFAVRKA